MHAIEIIATYHQLRATRERALFVADTKFAQAHTTVAERLDAEKKLAVATSQLLAFELAHKPQLVA